ncbi:Tyrosine-protein phosphatase non-receptor type 23, partial [Ophiophagus hannah]
MDPTHFQINILIYYIYYITVTQTVCKIPRGSYQVFVLKNYGENPEDYNEELKKLEQLRQNAVNVPRDFEGCSILRKYLGQLHYLQSRIPMGAEQEASVPITWTEIFSGKAVTHEDIKYEQACVLYNLGALHSMLGAMDKRVSEEGQAQECLLEKSMLDNRKSFLVARISAQLHMGKQAEEQQKYGERVTYFQSALDKLNEAIRLAKGQPETVQEALRFTMDVIGGNEEKAKLLRDVMAKIDAKNEILEQFMDSLQLDAETVDNLDVYDHIPPVLMEKCAALSVRPETVKNLVQSMQVLSGVFTDVEASLKEIKDLLEEDEAEEQKLRETLGKSPPPPLDPLVPSTGGVAEVAKEWAKYLEVHQKASFTNTELHKAMNLHITNLRLLSGPLEGVKAALPAPSLSEDDQQAIQNVKRLLAKVQEMRDQRVSLEHQLREMIQKDDLTTSLVTTDQSEMKNLVAQENILKALTEANVKYAAVRKILAEVEHDPPDLGGFIRSLRRFDEEVARRERILRRLGGEMKKKTPARPTTSKPVLQKKLSEAELACEPLGLASISLADLPEELRSLPPEVLAAHLAQLPADALAALRSEPPLPAAGIRGPAGEAFGGVLPLRPPFDPSQFPQPVAPGPPLPPPRTSPQHIPISRPAPGSVYGVGSLVPCSGVLPGGPPTPLDRRPRAPVPGHFAAPHFPPHKQGVRPATTTVDSLQAPISSCTAPQGMSGSLPQWAGPPSQGGFVGGPPGSSPYPFAYVPVSTASFLPPFSGAQPQPGFHPPSDRPACLQTMPTMLPPQQQQLPHFLPQTQQPQPAFPQPYPSQPAGRPALPYPVPAHPASQGQLGEVDPGVVIVVPPRDPLPPHSGSLAYSAPAPRSMMGPIQQVPLHPPVPAAPLAFAPTSAQIPGVPVRLVRPQPLPPVSQPPLHHVPPAPSPVGGAVPSPAPSRPTMTLPPPCLLPSQMPPSSLTPVPPSLPQAASEVPFQRQSSSTDDLLSSSPESQHGGPKAPVGPPLLQPTKADAKDGLKPKAVQLIENDPYEKPERLWRLLSELERFQEGVSRLEKSPAPGTVSELDNIWKELQDAQEKDARQLSIAIARCYTMKNRHQDIMPYDRNRVILQSGKDDYINASRIEDLSCYCPTIIATQAPLVGTASDFWLMIYEQKVSLVVMLVSEQEMEKVGWWWHGVGVALL